MQMRLVNFNPRCEPKAPSVLPISVVNVEFYHKIAICNGNIYK
jgi:hypothetical protein